MFSKINFAVLNSQECWLPKLQFMKIEVSAIEELNLSDSGLDFLLMLSVG